MGARYDATAGYALLHFDGHVWTNEHVPLAVHPQRFGITALFVDQRAVWIGGENGRVLVKRR